TCMVLAGRYQAHLGVRPTFFIPDRGIQGNGKVMWRVEIASVAHFQRGHLIGRLRPILRAPYVAGAIGPCQFQIGDFFSRDLVERRVTLAEPGPAVEMPFAWRDAVAEIRR